MNSTEETQGSEETKWITLTLDFTPEQEAQLQELADAAGMSLKCYCVRVLHAALLRDATEEERARWEASFPEMLRRNGCDPDSPKEEAAEEIGS